MQEAFTAFTAFLIAALPLSVAVTKIVDAVRNLDSGNRVPKVAWNILAMVVGVLVCLGWGFNLFAPLVAAVPALKDSEIGTGTGAEVLTGLAIGGMAGFWHERLDEWSSRAKAEHPVAP